MIVPIVVVLNGVLIPAVPPAQLVAGRVMAPVTAIVTRFADRVAVDAGGGIVIEAHGHRCALRIGVAEAACDGRTGPLAFAPYVDDGIAFVPLGDLARAFGGELVFDPASATAEVHIAWQPRLDTPPPSGAPPGGPEPALTPGPRPASPPPAEPEPSPRPRRTPLPALPS
jgi:hypothetical protein